MGSKTEIPWTDATWSPLRALVKSDAGAIAEAKGYKSLVHIATKMQGHAGPHCERVSHGCDNCYSDTNNGRCLPANGTGLPFDRRTRDLVEPFVDEKILVQPLKWRTPKKIFVENQSDLFGEWNSDEMIDGVFAIMALCSQHQFQVLTKRPERMLTYLSGLRERLTARHELNKTVIRGAPVKLNHAFRQIKAVSFDESRKDMAWPLPNVWLGVSVEDQATADARIPLLLQTPAAKGFVSYEPALGPVDFTRVGGPGSANHVANLYDGSALYIGDIGGIDYSWTPRGMLDWIIVGGESGPCARPFDIAWARQTVEQCKSAGVACFVKQLGAKPRDVLANIRDWPEWRDRCHQISGEGDKAVIETRLKDRKGGDMSEWPEDIRVRQFPGEGR